MFKSKIITKKKINLQLIYCTALAEDEPLYKCRCCDFSSDNAAETNYHMRADHASNGHIFCSYCPYLAVNLLKIRSGLNIQLYALLLSGPNSLKSVKVVIIISKMP